MGGKKKGLVENSSNLIIGTLLLTFGLIFFLTDLGVITFNPFYLTLIIGLAFITAYFLYANWVFLIPGVIVTLSGLIIVLGLETLWFLWVLIPGLSFTSVYFTKKKNTKWSLIPASVLVSVGLLGAFNHYTGLNAYPLVLILLGLYIMINNYLRE